MNNIFKRAGAAWQAFLILITWLAGSVALQAAEGLDVTDPQVVEAFSDGVIIPTMETNHSPSGVVAVMKDGKVIFAKGYGYIDVEKRIPVDPETSMFRPGSISKLFTWVSVMQLVEQGKIDLDVDVNTYLKTFKVKDSWPGQPVTMRHIMTHTAGFEDGFLGYLIINDPERILPIAESLAKYQPERVYPPGKHLAYSNWATVLAGLIVQNVSGQPFNDYVQEHIFDVLGMTRTTFVEPLPEKYMPYEAKGYDYNPKEDRYVEQASEILASYGPAGGSSTTALDMTKFARALLGGGSYNGGRILKEETLKQILDEGFTHDERVRGIGLGFLKRQYGSEDVKNYGHDGGTTFFISHFGLSQKENLMLFSSFSGPGALATHRAYVKKFYDEFYPREVPFIEPPKDFFERGQKYAGTYNSSRSSFTKPEALLRGLNSVKVQVLPDNTLMIGPDRYVEMEKNLFRMVDDYSRVAFQEDEEGNITHFVYDGLAVKHMYRAGFYETRSFINLAVGASLIVFLGVFVRLAYQWSGYRAMKAPERRAMEASFLVAGLNIMFLACVAWAFRNGVNPVMWKIPFSLELANFLANIAILAAFYHLYRAVTVWRAGLFKSWWARSRYSVITFFALLMAWFYYYWNFFGFNYFT
ncbi:serine hydrolase domain-containing protein [Emcibacter sp.]|uniref:serine hydrolase domain-containing protein n=1 Tax=Emcibacter sp. TaxID=1979954 RepID=UPI002AA63476|nr:serine hydrolase domain-containing protein [Emcibacter sp.]